MATDTPTSDLKAASAPGRWQFRLWHLFALMTYVAVILGIATWLGPPTLMVSCGLGLALLSHSQAFEKFQKGNVQQFLIGLAWVTYLVSLGIPCGVGLSTFVYGWEAAWVYIWGPFSEGLKGDTASPVGWLWVICIDISNLLQAILPLHFWRLRTGRGQWLATASCLVMVGPWTTLVMEPHLLAGYYLWCVSFMLIVIAVPVRRWTLFCMLGLSIALIVFFRT
jgi:hypothetical protein